MTRILFHCCCFTFLRGCIRCCCSCFLRRRPQRITIRAPFLNMFIELKVIIVGLATYEGMATAVGVHWISNQNRAFDRSFVRSSNNELTVIVPMNGNNGEECRTLSRQQTLHFPRVYKGHDSQGSISSETRRPDFLPDLFRTPRQPCRSTSSTGTYRESFPLTVESYVLIAMKQLNHRYNK